MQVWGKTGSKIYGPTSGEDYDDNQFRFMLLAKVDSCKKKYRCITVLALNLLTSTNSSMLSLAGGNRSHQDT